MAHATTWDVSQPPGTQSVGSGDDRIRDTRSAIVDRMAIEHYASDGSETDDTKYWKHKKTAGRINYGTSGARPAATTAINGGYYLETDTNLIKYCTASSWTSLGAAFHNVANYRYTTGKVNVTGSSATVAAESGASFITGGVSTNDIFVGPDSRSYKITNRAAGSLTISPNYAGTTATAQSYTVEFLKHNAYIPKYGGSCFGALSMENKQIRKVAKATSAGDALSWSHRIRLGAVSSSYTIALGGVHATSSINLTMLQRNGASSAVNITAKNLGGVSMKIGTYTGSNPTTKVVTGLGFQPRELILQEHGSSNAGDVIVTDTMGAGRAKKIGDGSYNLNIVTSLDADGFTLPGASPSNDSGTTYTYIARRY